MKRTIKQWCKESDLGWLGQGTTGGFRYDWKLVLGKGRTAIFSSAIKGLLPESRMIGTRKMLLFPNVNRFRNGGKISESAFSRLITWVEDCLAGNIRTIKEEPNKTRISSESSEAKARWLIPGTKKSTLLSHTRQKVISGVRTKKERSEFFTLRKIQWYHFPENSNTTEHIEFRIFLCQRHYAIIA